MHLHRCTIQVSISNHRFDTSNENFAYDCSHNEDQIPNIKLIFILIYCTLKNYTMLKNNLPCILSMLKYT